MNSKIVVLAGDGIGPEIMDSGLHLNLKNFLLGVQELMKLVLLFQKKHSLLVRRLTRFFWEQSAVRNGKKCRILQKKVYSH